MAIRADDLNGQIRIPMELSRLIDMERARLGVKKWVMVERMWAAYMAIYHPADEGGDPKKVVEIATWPSAPGLTLHSVVHGRTVREWLEALVAVLGSADNLLRDAITSNLSVFSRDAGHNLPAGEQPDAQPPKDPDPHAGPGERYKQRVDGVLGPPPARDAGPGRSKKETGGSRGRRRGAK